MAIIQVRVNSERNNTYEGKKGVVSEQILNLVDVDPSGKRLVHTVDYVMSEDEVKRYSGKLMDKDLSLAIIKQEEWMGAQRYRGEILAVPALDKNGKAAEVAHK